MTHQVTFDSAIHPEGKLLTLAAGYVSLTEITFVQEHVTVQIEAKTGALVFYNTLSDLRLSATMPTPVSGDEKYSEVNVQVQGNVIRLGFPQYTYVDNYPHCDGESDRWTKSIVGYTDLCYDFKANHITE